jgi:hypothetical protein
MNVFALFILHKKQSFFYLFHEYNFHINTCLTLGTARSKSKVHLTWYPGYIWTSNSCLLLQFLHYSRHVYYLILRWPNKMAFVLISEYAPQLLNTVMSKWIIIIKLRQDQVSLTRHVVGWYFSRLLSATKYDNLAITVVYFCFLLNALFWRLEFQCDQPFSV